MLSSALLISQSSQGQMTGSQSNDLTRKFSQAIIFKEISKIESYIKEQPELVNAELPGEDTPLIAAARWQDEKAAEILLAHGADVNATGQRGETALHLAAIHDDASLVRLLLRHKADPNAANSDDYTPIMSAKSLEVFKQLVAYGADIHIQTRFGDTALTRAVESKTGTNVVRFLLEEGADVTGSPTLCTAVDFGGDTNVTKLLIPYFRKSKSSDAPKSFAELLGYLIRRDNVNEVLAILDASLGLEASPLHKAVRDGDYMAVREMLTSTPAGVDERDFFGWTPLHIAIIAKRSELAKLLLAAGANVNTLDGIDNTPLLWAAYLGRSDIAETLVRHKALLNLGGNDGNTPLKTVIQHGFTPIATMLITNGADVNEAAPLHVAAARENVEVVKLLLDHGANPNATEGNYSDVRSALDIAVTGDSPAIVRLLIANGAKLTTQMQTFNGGGTTLFHLWAGRSTRMSAISHVPPVTTKGNPEIADMLLAKGCDFNAKDGDGLTPLHIAVGRWFFRYEVIPGHTNREFQLSDDYVMKDFGKEPTLWLLDHHADVNAKDNEGKTPLHLIVTTGNLKTIQCLLDHKADVNATDNGGKTPLALFEDMKIQEEKYGHGWIFQVDVKAVEKILLENGAKGPILSQYPGQ
jgi:ankyrin repeat protein